MVTALQKYRGLTLVLLGTPFYGAWAALSIGSGAVLFLNELGFPKSQIGFLFGLIPFVGLIALFIAPWTVRFGLKRSYITFYGIRKIVLALLIFAPWVSAQFGMTAAFAFVTSVILVFAVFRVIAETALTPWQQEFIPPAIWGKFSAVSSIAVALAGAIATTLASIVLERGTGFLRYQVLMGIGAVCGVIYVASFLTVDGGKPTSTQAAHTEYLAQMGLALRNREFLRHMAGLGAVSLVSGAWSVFLPLYMRDLVALSAGTVILLQVLTMLGTLLASYGCGWLSDRYGSKPIVLGALAILGLLPLGWWVMPRQAALSATVALALAFLLGVGTAGWSIGQGRWLWVKVIPPAQKTGYNAVYYAWLGVISGLSPFLAGWSLDALRHWPTSSLLTLPLDAYTPLWVTSLAMIALSFGLFWQLKNDRMSDKNLSQN